MGLTYHEIRQLLLGEQHSMGDRTVLTVGRQNLFLHDRDLASLCDEFGLDDAARRAARPFGCYAEAFLQETIGPCALTSLDASNYEGATLVHDLNVPTPEFLDQTFDVVVDGGSLEHVFNFPIALANLMRMTRTGGRVYMDVPANNLCGHGFYQFSPELMFRVFDERHGFTVKTALLIPARFPGVELTPSRRAFCVRDPAVVGDRVALVSRRPVTIVVVAEKLRHMHEPFADAPQQSDYSARWREGRPHSHSDGGLIERVPLPLRLSLRGYRQRLRSSLLNRRVYEPLGKPRGEER